MTFTPKNKKAYILVEAILGVAIFSIIVVAFLFGLIRIREVPFFAGSRDRAIFIAEEGLEAVKNIVDADFANLSDGDHGLTVSSNQWEFSGTSDTVDSYFTRQLTISTVDAYTKQVDSTVTWQQTDSRTGQILLTTYFTDYDSGGLDLSCDWSTISVPGTFDYTGNQDVYKTQVQNSHAYTVLLSGAPTADFSIINITNASSPSETGSLSIASSQANSLTNIAVRGDYAYVSSENDSAELSIIDISDPSDPSVVGSFDAAGSTDALGVYVIGTTVYLSKEGGTGDEFFIIDASTPATPSLVGSVSIGGTNAGGTELWVSGDYAYIASPDSARNLKIVDITDPALPVYQVDSGYEATQSTNKSSQTITGFNNTIVLGNDDGNLYFIDITDPTAVDQTSEISRFDIGDVIYDVSVGSQAGVDNTIVFTVSEINVNDELQLINITNINSPVALSSYQFSMRMYGTAFDDQSCKGVAVGTVNNDPEMSIFTAGDVTAPAAVSDLALSGETTTTIDLDWTAPGDDSTTGTATTYDIRYSTATITDLNWASATQVTGEPTPSIAGSAESMTVSDLTADTQYYFAIKTVDEIPNDSDLSNVPNLSTEGGSQTFRITEYYIASGTFSGDTYDLTLDEDLTDDYFVMLQGSDGDGTGNNNRGPDENYISLVSDPSATGDLTASGSTDVLSFQRGNSVNSWVGVVTVVECLEDCDVSGFELLSVERTVHSGVNETGTDTSASSWTDIDQVMLMGGFSGAGCDTTETSTGDHKACQNRIWPSSTNTINWQRDSTGGGLGDATSTVMVLDWGSDWTVQRANVTGSAGGGGANATGEYNTASITSVARANTWVWGTGWTNDGGIGDSSEGSLITLGNGVDQNTNETTVAVGQEYSDSRDFEVYALTHSDAAVDYRFKADGNSGDLIYDATTDTITETDARFAIVTNGCNGTGGAFPRPIFSARYYDNSTIRLERRRSGQNFPAWVQGIDLSAIVPVIDITAPEAVSDLATSGATSTTIDLDWTAPGDDGATGTATTYDVRYSTSAITAGNWGSATQATGEPTPSVAGSSESMTISGLTASTTYYFAIKTSDEVPNESAISNFPSLSTTAPVLVTLFYETFSNADSAWDGSSDTSQSESGWSVIQGSGDNNDVQVSNEAVGNPPSGGTHLTFEDCDQGFNSPENYDLAYASIDLSSYNTVTIEYYWQSDDTDGNEGLRVAYSTDSTNGTDGTWTQIAEELNPTDNIWTQVQYSLPDVSAVSNFKLRFSSKSNSTNEHIYFDDVKLTGYQ
jgi:hypothetical protein